MNPLSYPKLSIIVRANKELIPYLKKIFSSLSFLLRFIDLDDTLPNGDRPEFIFHICDYKCNLFRCAPSFNMSNKIDGAFIILRPVLLSEAEYYSAGFFLLKPKPGNTSISERHIEDQLRNLPNYGFHKGELHPTNPLNKILNIEKRVAEEPWNKQSIKDFSNLVHRSPSWISSKFKKMVGIPLKTLLLRNIFCFALWQIITTEKSIKEIAIELGYEPLYFSKGFHLHFGIWPSQIRKGM